MILSTSSSHKQSKQMSKKQHFHALSLDLLHHTISRCPHFSVGRAHKLIQDFEPWKHVYFWIMLFYFKNSSARDITYCQRVNHNSRFRNSGNDTRVQSFSHNFTDWAQSNNKKRYKVNVNLNMMQTNEFPMVRFHLDFVWLFLTVLKCRLLLINLKQHFLLV